MNFRPVYTLLLGLLLGVATVSIAQETATPPSPVNLQANWWSYFQPDVEETNESLSERIEKTTQQLRSLGTQSSPDEIVELTPLIDSVVARLQRYGEYAAMQLPVAPVPLAARESYSLDQLSKLVEDLRKTVVERSAENQDIAALERAISNVEREQSQRKVAYLALDAVAPERTRLGLELMQTRLQLELAKRELQFRNASLSGLEEQLSNLRPLLAAAALRLTSGEAAIKDVAARREQALREAAALRAKLAKLELTQSGALALLPVDQARAQTQAQRVMALEAEALTKELVVVQLAIADVLLRRAAADNLLDPAPHRKELREYDEQLELARQRLRAIRDDTLRGRTATLTRVATEADAKIAQFLRERITAADDTEHQIAALDEQLSVSEQFSTLLGDQLVEAEGTVGFTMQLLREGAGDAWAKLSELASASLFEISETPVTTLGLLRMILIMTIAWWISKLARRALLSVAARRESVNNGSIYTLSRMLHYAILAIGIMVALSSIGIDFTKFALFASALGVGIGFGLQTLVSNFVAGLIILFEKSLKIGDFVELESGVTGEVKEINMRSTLVTTNDNIDIVVPNSEFVNSRVTNWTMREAYRRIHISFGVAYGTDKELVKRAALEAATEVDVTLTGVKRREPQVWFVEFGDSSLNFELVVWLTPAAVKRPGAVHATYLWAIDDKLRKYQIEVPFPQRDLHLRSAFGFQDKEGYTLLRDDLAADGGN